jgi:hypothetical protein
MWTEPAAGTFSRRYRFEGKGELVRRRRIMRNAMLAMVALMSAGAATIVGPTPAAAIDYPYCIQGGGWGVPGDCSYRSYAECMASASGRRVYCNVNPRVAFGQQRRSRYYRYY